MFSRESSCTKGRGCNTLTSSMCPHSSREHTISLSMFAYSNSVIRIGIGIYTAFYWSHTYTKRHRRSCVCLNTKTSDHHPYSNRTWAQNTCRRMLRSSVYSSVRTYARLRRLTTCLRIFCDSSEAVKSVVPYDFIVAIHNIYSSIDLLDPNQKPMI